MQMILQTKKLDKQTMDLEKVFVKELTDQYMTAKDSIQKELGKAFAKYSKGDVLTYGEMAKYDRLQKLLNNINGELATLNRGMTSTHTAHAMRVYELNYTGLGEIINEAANISRNWGILNKDAIRESILTPLDKLAISDNADVVKANIKKQITQSLVKGEGIKKMSDGIQSVLETNANRAVTIARTETTRVMNSARLDTIKNAESETIKLQKRWVATNDGRTRDSHSNLQGETVDNDESFSNGLMYPGDPSGDAAEVVNCRCAMGTELVIL